MITFENNMDIRQINALGSLQLAHIGDAVYELLVRTYLSADTSLKSDSIHKRCIKMVNASSQAIAADSILHLLTEQEFDVYRRGKNAKVNSIPKNASVAVYHKATGLEALFGWLYLNGEKDRLYYLFDYIVSEKVAENVT